jgi:SPP1 family phage portal protein
MAKVNEFETASYTYSAGPKQRFPDAANMHYRYPSAEGLVNGVGLQTLAKMVQHHQESQRPRLVTLENYYKGNNETILSGVRRKEEHQADHRATHNFAKYVSQFIQGYMAGIPVKTTYPEDKVNDKLKEINRVNDADEHNSDLTLYLSIYGRSYELLYRNERDETRFTLAEPRETFVIYDNTVEMNPIAGVRYINNVFDEDNLTVYVYTDKGIHTFEARDVNSIELVETAWEAHAFDGIPIIEYQNNRFRQGDFEDVLNLIDLYDSAQSDTANYMTDFNDAMLKIAGNIDIDPETAKQMKEANILLLQSEINADGKVGTVDADYIYKQYDVAGTEAYKSRLENDIHKHTNTPNMNDDSFGGTQSGESMKYKLFGLEQVRATKERLFKKSIRDRYRLISNLGSAASELSLDVNDIKITFTPNLPKSMKEEIENFVKLGGTLSDETKLTLLSLVENPKEELDKIEEERKERDVFAETYGFASLGGGTNGENVQE